MLSGVTGLQEFVNVALHTATGEGALPSAQLSDLKTIGTGFKPLIYDLPENANFELFQEKCELLWKDMQQQLPNLLV